MFDDVRKMVKEVSRIGVAFGFVYLVLGLILLAAGYPHRHAYVLGLGSLLLLPHSVALAYIGSAVHNKQDPFLSVTLLASVPLIVLPMLGIMLEYKIFLAWFGAVSLLSSFSSIRIASKRKSSLKLSLVMVALTYIAAFFAILYGFLEGFPPKFSELILGLILAYPVPLIFSITVHALPSTFKDEPLVPASILALIFSGASSLLVLGQEYVIGLSLALVSLLIYTIAARFYRLPLYSRRIPIKDKDHPAYQGAKYFITGHYYVILVIAIIAAYTILYFNNSGCTLLCLVHAYSMGFIALHFMIHGPMMLPVILRVKHRKKFTQTPYLLILFSLLLWPSLGIGSYILFLFSLIVGFRIVK